MIDNLPFFGGDFSDQSPRPLSWKYPWKPGDFFSMVYGFSRLEVYVLSVETDGLRFSRKDWLASANMFISYKDLYDTKNATKFICHGKEKWYWKYLPWRDLIVKYKKVKLKVIN